MASVFIKFASKLHLTSSNLHLSCLLVSVRLIVSVCMHCAVMYAIQSACLSPKDSLQGVCLSHCGGVTDGVIHFTHTSHYTLCQHIGEIDKIVYHKINCIGAKIH